MAARPLSREESLGLALAVLGHGALVAWLLLQRPALTLPPPPERMAVTISDEAGPVPTSPEPLAAPAPDKGPVLGEAPPPVPEPLAKPEPPRSAPVPALKTPAKSSPPKPAPPRQTAKPGASAFDRDFGAGIPAATPGKSKNPPAALASAQQRSSWSSLIGSKVRGPWNACSVQGLDVQELRAAVHFTLNADGTVLSIDEPVITGVSPSNRPQVRPFRDCAVRAIKLAAPFSGLPAEFYDDWKTRNLTFRKASGQ